MGTVSDVVLSGTSVTVNVHLAGLRVEHHCELHDGRHSFVVTGGEADGWQRPDVYLLGTPEELREFAASIVTASYAIPRREAEHG